MIDTDQIAVAVASQPELFGADEDGSPMVEPGIVAAAREFSTSPVHTGRTVTKDEARCAAAWALLASGVSRRTIARRLRMGRHTLDAIEAEFERGGKLAPLKERVSRQLALLVSDAAEQTRESLESGVRDAEGAAWLKAVATALGIGFDKHALATGGPTEIVEQRGPDPRQAVRNWWSKVVDGEVVTDSASVSPPLAVNGLRGSLPALPTDAEVVDQAVTPVGPAPGTSGRTAPNGGQAAQAGGGDSPRAGGALASDGSTSPANYSQMQTP